MTLIRKGAAILLLMLLVTPHLIAQPVPAAAAAATTPPTGLAALCAMIDAKIQACKAQICACPLGQMLTNMQSVFNLYGGGMCCPPCCPPVNPDDLKKPSDTAGGACARFKQDLMEMPKRRDAVRCLAYADCHWWPEVEAALITSLRTDRNECVRMEAAKVLCSGCCCTKKTIEALVIVVSGSNRDGNPSENSPRVKAAAMAALQHCVDCYTEKLPEPERPEQPERAPAAGPKAIAGADPNVQPAGARPPLAPAPDSLAAAVANARHILDEAHKNAPPNPTGVPTGQQGLLQIAAAASRPPSNVVPAALPQSPPTTPAPPLLPAETEEPANLPPTGSRGLLGVFTHTVRSRPVVVQEMAPPAPSVARAPSPWPPPPPVLTAPAPPPAPVLTAPAVPPLDSDQVVPWPTPLPLPVPPQ